MYTKQDMVNKLINENKAVDFETIYCSLANWDIKPVYVDENNIEFFDENSMKKLNEAIDLKNQGKSDCDINRIINNCKKTDLENENLNNIAEKIAQKVSGQIYEKLMNLAKLKRDNEILAQQIEKLLEENKKLTSKVNSLEEDKLNIKHLYGSIYLKKH